MILEYLRKYRVFLLLSLIILSVFFMFAFNVEGLEVGRDEGVHGFVARVLSEDGRYALRTSDGYLDFDRRIAVGPTIIIPASFAIKYFGAGIMPLRIVPAIYFLLFVLLFFSLSRKSLGFKVSAVLVVLVLSAQWPFFKQEALFIPIYRTLTGEAGALFFLLLGLYFWDGYFKKGRKWMFYLGSFLAGFSVLTKLQFVIAFIPFTLSYFIAKKSKSKREAFFDISVSAFLFILPLLSFFIYQFLFFSTGGFLSGLSSYARFKDQLFKLSFFRIKQNIIDKWLWLNPLIYKIYFTLPSLIYGLALLKKDSRLRKNMFFLFSLLFSLIWMLWYAFSRGFIRYEIPGLVFSLVPLSIYLAKTKDFFSRSVFALVIIFSLYINFREAKVVEDKSAFAMAQSVDSIPKGKRITAGELDYSVDYFLHRRSLSHAPEGANLEECFTPSNSDYILAKKNDPAFECALGGGEWILKEGFGPYRLYEKNL